MKFITEKNAFPWQAKALKAVRGCLRHANRCVVCMACGTGKTFVEAWLADGLRPGTTVVLIPSLYLMSQVAEEFKLSGFLENKSVLYVCSDDTVAPDDDQNVMRPADCPWPVTTDPKEVRAFMRAGHGEAVVVFCTYASAKLLTGLKFDLGIFEEAHRTAGRVDALFTFALHDKNIKIKQRVFFTATPKTYRSTKDRDGVEAVHCMDGPTYGAKAFTYTLREGIKDGAICPYEIIAITVKSKQISAALQKARVNPIGSGVDLHAVGCALAIVQACRENDIKKVFTYHRLIKDAQDFVTAKVVTDILGEWFQKDQMFTIDGSMNDTQRRHIMANFSAGRRGLISNAKCLAEGVNTPDADAVAILNPKRGKIDVVQTAGRPLRLAKGKSKAYIILPFFVEDSENKAELHDKLGASDYASVWDVVAAMAGSDPSLQHVIDNFRQKKGETGSYGDFEALGEFIKISGTGFDMEEMRNAICCRVVEALSSDWMETWGKVLAFKKRTGRWPMASGDPLANWLRDQRRLYGERRLSEERTKLLKEAGFDLEPQSEKRWMSNFYSLKKYIEKGKFPSESSGVYDWAARLNKNWHTLPDWQKKLLIEIKFVWPSQDRKWEQRLDEYVKFIESGDSFENHREVYNWRQTQKAAKRDGTLPKEREDKLNLIDFFKPLHELEYNWKKIEAQNKTWDNDYETYKNHVESGKEIKKGSQLQRWRLDQLKDKKKLSKEKIEKLKRIGFFKSLHKNKKGKILL